MLTINIELSTSHDKPDADVIMLKIVRAVAKQLVTQASLIADRRPPKIKVIVSDNHTPRTELKLFDEDGSEMDSDISEAKYKPGTYGLSAIAINTLLKLDE